MVSLNTILAVGGIGAAYLLFKSLGGASGIGSSIGRGASQFSESIVSGLTGNALTNFDNPLNTSTPAGFRLDPNKGQQSYDDYINYKDDQGNTPTAPAGPDDDDYTPFKFNAPAYAEPSNPLNYFKYNSGNFFEQTPIEERFPNARVATYSERTQLANLTGGLLG
jgi:hypothetical protein